MHLRLVGALAAGSARGADQRSFEELADVRFRVKGALRDGRRQRGIRSSGNPIYSSAMSLASKERTMKSRRTLTFEQARGWNARRRTCGRFFAAVLSAAVS